MLFVAGNPPSSFLFLGVLINISFLCFCLPTQNGGAIEAGSNTGALAISGCAFEGNTAHYVCPPSLPSSSLF